MKSSQPDAASGPPAKAAPKSWADLVRTTAPPKMASAVPESNAAISTNGAVIDKSESLINALSSYNVENVRNSSKISFLEPRGLVNTGNMCYMNSVRST